MKGMTTKRQYTKQMKLFKTLHSVAGTAIAVFFFMWFFTGLVLIYHPYPRLDEQQQNHLREDIKADSLLPISYYTDSLADDTVQFLRVSQRLGQPLVTVGTADSSYTMCSDTTAERHSVTFTDVEDVASLWIGSKPARVDTLHERAQWILYERYERAMPIYKFTYDDDEGHELFVSGKTGEVQQLTTRSQRIWAWLGAIPHKFYYPCIRKDVDLWKTVITTGGIICLLAGLSGFIYGWALQTRVARKKGWLCNPFKNPVYKWHHILGLIFGVFIICWGISGSLSMQKVPKWLVPYENEYSMYAPDIWEGDSLPLHSYHLDYRRIIAEYPDVKQVEWHVIGGKPAYTVISDSNCIFVDATDTVPKPLTVTAESVSRAMHRLYGEDTQVNVQLMKDYDEYYMASYDTHQNLPVYKVTVDDADGSTYYIGVDNDYCRYFNNNKKVRKWLFGAMHYLNIKGIADKPLLWHTCMWILCLAGMAISLTGIALGVRYARRKAHKIHRHNVTT